LEIIRRVPGFDTRESLLMTLNGGYAWLFMERELFPKLRRVELRIEYSTTAAPYNEPTARDYTQTASPQPYNPTASPQPSPKEREPGRADSDGRDKAVESGVKQNRAASDSLSLGEGRGEAIRTRFALKTNLLLWAGVQSDFKHTAPVTNVALEYYINDHWSVELGAKYSYWHYNSHQEFQGVSGYRLEPRYRYALNDRLEVYLGLYGRSGDYDSRTLRESVDSSQLTVDNDAQPNSQFSILNSQFNKTLNYTGDYWDAGLSAGISIRLVGNLGLEAGARAGYVSTDAYKYIQANNYNWFESRWKYSKVRITDLDLNLIYKF
jgi:hypothetical protein